MSLGGEAMFHGQPIPPQYARVTIEDVSLNLPLMISAEDDDQATLSDVLGSSVLWFRGFLSSQE